MLPLAGLVALLAAACVGLLFYAGSDPAHGHQLRNGLVTAGLTLFFGLMIIVLGLGFWGWFNQAPPPAVAAAPTADEIADAVVAKLPPYPSCKEAPTAKDVADAVKLVLPAAPADRTEEVIKAIKAIPGCPAPTDRTNEVLVALNAFSQTMVSRATGSTCVDRTNEVLTAVSALSQTIMASQSMSMTTGGADRTDELLAAFTALSQTVAARDTGVWTLSGQNDQLLAYMQAMSQTLVTTCLSRPAAAVRAPVPPSSSYARTSLVDPNSGITVAELRAMIERAKPYPGAPQYLYPELNHAREASPEKGYRFDNAINLPTDADYVVWLGHSGPTFDLGGKIVPLVVDGLDGVWVVRNGLVLNSPGSALRVAGGISDVQLAELKALIATFGPADHTMDMIKTTSGNVNAAAFVAAVNNNKCADDEVFNALNAAVGNLPPGASTWETAGPVTIQGGVKPAATWFWTRTVNNPPARLLELHRSSNGRSLYLVTDGLDVTPLTIPWSARIVAFSGDTQPPDQVFPWWGKDLSTYCKN
jgi:hypothetical protein